ncbi:hypothetical protein [Tepidibacter formicigenes]|jgi:hypothetical protein|uniref:Uncharacterized protein n=1 Tax=Tepidibacter formicigenes DSM 15518 TaxID=1123349 RepID=A0A1M6SYY0_9FIRM|nr:hypothetical protein [Tepidibacter formicigenes]SHK49748.1 hypothetical protein SAMN02744037_02461 [Tepidibacter formicigenes DSM 15518]
MYEYFSPFSNIEKSEEYGYRKKINKFAYVYHKNGFNYLAYIKKDDREYCYLCRWNPCERRWYYKQVKKKNIKDIEYFKPDPC